MVSRWPRRAQVFAFTAASFALLAGVAALASGVGHRFGLWDYRFAFALLRYAAWTGIAGALLSLVALGWNLKLGIRVGAFAAFAGIVAGALTFGVPWMALQEARRVPPIHDISTDTLDPPRFVALLAVRRAAPNGADYAGEAVAAEQRKAYPDIVPLSYAAPAPVAFARAENASRALGWTIVEADPQALRIEATDQTPFFGFKDDVVIRITPLGEASRVDVRSMSRVGRSDLGANARRIRAFFKELARRG